MSDQEAINVAAAASSGYFGGSCIFGGGGGGSSGGGGGSGGGGSSGGGGGGGYIGSFGATACFSARQTRCASDVREGRLAQKCFGALNALANTIEAGAIHDVPSLSHLLC